ncbi:helix-turn-helix domain-containing protein [Shimwellia pseudoproteus]|uniref:helix-turn-helix domain-containing protein n=1 Tax=Shimwellia pseudoproteus TaxID=570012 RepID=UPI0018EAF99C|nr:helix-turn-helix domain-containing protein [Shimwellia pseudoproteus]MBJ3816785.1 helix-turn-helix domain-containing protein [Shimwellia pseudoproteus]
MPLHSVSEAAKLAGVTRRTIYRHLENGKLQAIQSGSKNTRIETRELLRVYGDTFPLEDNKIPAELSIPHEISRLLSEMANIHRELLRINNRISTLFHLYPSDSNSLPQGEHRVLEWVKARRRQRTVKEI